MKTLTIVLCQTRDAGLTIDSIHRNLLEPMNSDLAYCGAAPTEADDPIVRNATYVWQEPEPDDWADRFDGFAEPTGAWRDLTALDPMLLGGTGVGASTGSGGIVLYWRERLRQHLTRDILDRYDWFVITRSDFRWSTPHPDVSLLDPEHIYFLDGERYGGVSDRHVLVSRRYAESMLAVPEPIFRAPLDLYERLRGIEFRGLNIETFIAFRLAELGLTDRVRFLPYIGFTVRHGSTPTRWGAGTFNRHLGLYVKYPKEYRQARIARVLIRRPDQWRGFFTEPQSLRFRVLKAIVAADRLRWRISGRAHATAPRTLRRARLLIDRSSPRSLSGRGAP